VKILNSRVAALYIPEVHCWHGNDFFFLNIVPIKELAAIFANLKVRGYGTVFLVEFISRQILSSGVEVSL